MKCDLEDSFFAKIESWHDEILQEALPGIPTEILSRKGNPLLSGFLFAHTGKPTRPGPALQKVFQFQDCRVCIFSLEELQLESFQGGLLSRNIVLDQYTGNLLYFRRGVLDKASWKFDLT